MNPYLDFQITEKEIPFIKFRQFKALTKNQGWIIPKKRINTPEKLKQWLIRFNPTKCYYTNCLFLAPQLYQGLKLKGAGYELLSKCWMKADIFFDLDAEKDHSNLEELRLEAIKLLDYMKNEKGFKLRHINWSGGAGLHLIYDDLTMTTIANPLKRMEIYKQERQKLLERLPSLKLLDKDCTIDHVRILKIPNSFDTKSGYKVQKISESDLRNNSMKKIVSQLHHIPVRGENSNEETKRLFSATFVVGDLSAGSSTSGKLLVQYPLLYGWLPNNVFGLKDSFVPFLRIKKQDFNKDELNKIQLEYKMGDIICLDYGDFIGCLAFKIVSRRRLEKILRRSKSNNLHELLKKGFNKIRTTAVEDSNLKILQPKPKLLDIILLRSKGMMSKPHSVYFTNLTNFSNEFIGVPFKYQNISKVTKEIPS